MGLASLERKKEYPKIEFAIFMGHSEIAKVVSFNWTGGVFNKL